MKTSGYVDYKKASDYFTDRDELLKKEIRQTEKQKDFIIWVQEFSKKIVVAVFVLYIFTLLSSLIAIFISVYQGNIYGIDTLISEINQTFREVVGGYIIKSAVENSFKIAGNYFLGICDARLKAMKAGLEKEDVKGMDKIINPYETNKEIINTDGQNNYSNEIIEFDTDI